MTLKIGINGFGRIGRNVLRAIIEQGYDEVEVVAINDLAPVETNAHLLRYDSVHGRFRGTVTVDGDVLDAGTGPIRVTAERDPTRLPWADVDLVMECTGVFKDRDKAALHFENGAKKVLVSAPAKGADRTVVFGVNHGDLTADDRIVSNASCTTNCLAPVAKVLNETIGIEYGYMTTIHAYTGDQPTLDTAHKDLNRARAAAMSMIPTSTGAAAALGLVLPELDGRLNGSAIRVPTPNVSCVDLKFHASRATSVDEINDAMRIASEEPLKGVLDYEEVPLVSIDFNHDPHSSNFAALQTSVTGGKFARVLSWYDNEWAFSCRMIDTALAMAKA